MAVTLTHSKVSTIPDGADTTLIRPSDWNAAHSLSGQLDVTNGGTGASTAANARINLGLSNFADTTVANTFTAVQTPDGATAAVSATGTYTFDGADQVREITFTNAITVTFGAPTGISRYAMYKFMLKAGDTSARTFAWNAAFKFPAGSAPLVSGTTTNGSYDIISFIGGASNTLLYQGHLADVR